MKTVFLLKRESAGHVRMAIICLPAFIFQLSIRFHLQRKVNPLPVLFSLGPFLIQPPDAAKLRIFLYPSHTVVALI